MKKRLLFSVILVTFSLLFIPACKTAEDVFNIVGTWNITLIYTGYSSPYSGTITFAGTESSGTFVASITDPASGTYTVNDNSVSFSLNWTGYTDMLYANGTATTDNNMNGTFTQTGGYSGTWSAYR